MQSPLMCFSQILEPSTAYCPMPENVFPYILSSFIVLHSGGLSLVPATMSWSLIVHTFISMLRVCGKKKKKSITEVHEYKVTLFSSFFIFKKILRGQSVTTRWMAETITLSFPENKWRKTSKSTSL